MAVLKEKYEINKPSSLTQSVYCDVDKKTGEFSIQSLDPIQLDLINAMYYDIHKQVNMNKEIQETIINSDKGGSTEFEISLADMATMINKYSNNQYDQMIMKIRGLQAVHIVINALNKEKDLETTYTSIITEVTTTKGKNRKIRAAFPNRLIRSYNNTQKYFKKHYLSIQFSLKSKYSKLLYELAKDYEGLENGITIDFESLLELLNVTTESMKVPSRFRVHILEKSIEEINEKTDIIISYSMNKKSKKDVSINIKAIKQDDSKLESLGLISPSVDSNKYYKFSKEKLDKLKEIGYDVYDDEAWIKTDLENNSKNYEMRERIDVWLEDTPETDKNDFFMNLAKYVGSGDPAVIIDNYSVRDLFGGKSYTNNAEETVKLMNDFRNNVYVVEED